VQRFDGRNAVVTGAASGIGRATVDRLVDEGARVLAVDLPSDALTALASDEVIAIAGDVSDPRTADAAVAAALNRLGPLSVLCNVAGILRTGHTHETSLDEWERVLAVNLTGTFLFCRAAIPALLSAGRGAIVNVSSIAALAGQPWAAAYGASKAGVLALTRTIAVEYGRQGLRANAVCPGSIDTPITASFKMPEGADPRLIHRVMALDKQRGPETVAAAIAFLASDDAAHVNGESLRVDGATLA
jgi:NAD(P)-dependent dehydrogenase (short-subunit alcohol dehydrogenase family)